MKIFKLYFILSISLNLFAQHKLVPWLQVHGKIPGQDLGYHVGGTVPKNNYPFNINVGNKNFSEHYLLKLPSDTSKKSIFKETINKFADMNGDGIVDIISAPHWSKRYEGYAKIYFGNETGFDTLNPLELVGEKETDDFTPNLIYDLNKDGLNDLICLSPFNNKARGKVYVYYGPLNKNKTIPDFTILGDSANHCLGYGATAGDLNDDGNNELIVHGILYDLPTRIINYIRIYWGNDSNYYKEYTELRIPDNGSNILNSFDVNGDNIDDLIWTLKNINRDNFIVIYYGGKDFDTTPDLQSEDLSVSFLASNIYKVDINGDKYDDIILTSPGGTGPLLASYVFIYCAGPNIDPTFDAAIGMSMDAMFGYSVDSTGDLNGDGISEIIIGAHNYDMTGRRGYWGVFKGSRNIRVNYIKENNLIPNNFKLFNAFPNPFNPTTTIKFEIPQDAFINLKIYDISGKEVQTLVYENMKSGNYSYKFNASDLASGVYFYQLIAQKNNKILFSDSKKLILVK